MKIAISADCFSAFTSGYPVRGMCLALIRNNPDITFVLYYTRRKRPEVLEDFYAEIHSLPNTQVRYIKGNRKAVAIKRLLSLPCISPDPDTDCFLNPGYPEYLCNYRGVQICSLADLSTLKGLSTGRYAQLFKYRNKMAYKRILPRFSKVVTVSEYTRQDIDKLFPGLNIASTTIYNGIDNFWFETDCPAVDKAVPGLNRPYFIWWGLISRRKNIRNLISAYKEARVLQPDLPALLLVGNIEKYMEDIKAEFDSNIVHIPFQDKMILKALVRRSRGLIFPSLYEGFGLPVIEAFSQGINVACSNVTSLPEVAHGHALLFNPHQIGEIRDAILRLGQLGDNVSELKSYAAQFSYDKAAEQYINLIKMMVG